jgi:hypothetical protein
MLVALKSQALRGKKIYPMLSESTWVNEIYPKTRGMINVGYGIPKGPYMHHELEKLVMA